MLLREVHHRVRNNLQVIGSLLSLQAEELHDDGELRALQVAQNRVHSIAAVHDLLYVSTSAASIDLHVYTQNLSESLAMAYGVSDRIQSHVEGGHLSLDVGRAVLVGLVLNELISNAYKHAFPYNRTGRVIVGIAATDEEIIFSMTDTGRNTRNSGSNATGITRSVPDWHVGPATKGHTEAGLGRRHEGRNSLPAVANQLNTSTGCGRIPRAKPTPQYKQC
jgi:two-component sensor histidine kinase